MRYTTYTWEGLSRPPSGQTSYPESRNILNSRRRQEETGGLRTTGLLADRTPTKERLQSGASGCPTAPLPFQGVHELGNQPLTWPWSCDGCSETPECPQLLSVREFQSIRGAAQLQRG